MEGNLKKTGIINLEIEKDDNSLELLYEGIIDKIEIPATIYDDQNDQEIRKLRVTLSQIISPDHFQETINYGKINALNSSSAFSKSFIKARKFVNKLIADEIWIFIGETTINKEKIPLLIANYPKINITIYSIMEDDEKNQNFLYN